MPFQGRTGNLVMGELVAWFLLLGIAITIVGIWMLSSQLKKHTQEMAEIILLTLAELKRLTSPAAWPVEPAVGVVLERRCAHRRTQKGPMSERAGYAEQRRSPGRRREDLVVVKNAG
jgi:hypothetical protein